jgi:hypothetical protein
VRCALVLAAVLALVPGGAAAAPSRQAVPILMYTLHRVRVNGGDGVAGLAARLR